MQIKPLEQQMCRNLSTPSVHYCRSMVTLSLSGQTIRAIQLPNRNYSLTTLALHPRYSASTLEPMAGFEPATDGLRNRCSTTELHWLFGRDGGEDRTDDIIQLIVKV